SPGCRFAAKGSEISEKSSDGTSTKRGSVSAGDVEAKIEDRGAVGNPAAGNQVDAGGGDGGRGFQTDPPGGFGNGPLIDHHDGPAHRFRRHVVEQYRVDPDLQGFGELVERVDLELDL